MQRVLVIGPCGSGKSTLSAELGRRLGLPVHHMDHLGWKPGWVETDREELRARLQSILATDRWLIDGNYGGTLELRMPRADTIVYLDFPIRLCLWRLVRRIVAHRGRSRPDMAEGCPERLDVAFLFYVLRWNSGPRIRTERRLKGFEGRLVRLKSPKALGAWLTGLSPASPPPEASPPG